MDNNLLDWTAKSLAWATQHMRKARSEVGLNISNMPPHLTLLSFKDDLIIMEEPRFLDTDPTLWSLFILQWLEDKPHHQGFLLWCIMEDGEGVDRACVITWKRGMVDPICMLMGLDFAEEGFVSVSLFDVLPQLAIDYNEQLITH